MGNKKSIAASESSDSSESEETSTHSNDVVSSRRINVQMVQNVRLIWLDNIIGDDFTDCRDTIIELRHAINTVNTFTDSEECIEFLDSISDEKVCMIISSSFGQRIVPRIHNMPQVDSIFIYCGNKKRHQKWAKEWPKIKGVFTEISSICEALKQAAQECEQNAIPISFMSTIGDDAFKKNLDHVDPSFVYTRILKEILLTIEFEQQHITEFIDYCRNALAENEGELKNVRKFERKYRDETPIWWYTYDCFLYPMLNRALRVMDVDVIIKMGFFIRDLHRQIERLHSDQFNAQNFGKTFTVYRGQGMSKANFEQMTKNKGGLISFNNFLSTSIRRDRSLDFARRALPNSDMMGILFVMTIDPSKSTVPFAFITDVSYFEDKDEVLFSMHTVFRICEIKSINKSYHLFQVELILTSDNDKDLRVITDCIQEATFPDAKGWYRLGLLLLKMSQWDKAQQIYEIMLEQTIDKSERGHIYHLLGWVKYNQREYKQAITFYEKALEIYKKTLSPTSLRLDDCYNNIGLVYDEMGEYSKALSYYEKSLEIKQQSLPSDHPDVARSYDKIGLIYFSTGNYPKALSSHEKALQIFRKTLPSNHPDLAHPYNHIGLVYHNMGEYQKALLAHEKALKIRQQSFSPDHPELAKSYIAHGIVYDQLREYSKAITFYEKALEIQQQSLPSNHPDLAISYSNLGLVYFNMGNYQKALSFLEKSLEIQQQCLLPNHPDLAISYGHIGNVYSSMGEYSKALPFCECAVDIIQNSLPSNHPHLRWYKNKLDKVKENL
jgi:tetratricopeptide (TPR) repeat protein